MHCVSVHKDQSAPETLHHAVDHSSIVDLKIVAILIFSALDCVDAIESHPIEQEA
jgi:hypothetical protein